MIAALLEGLALGLATGTVCLFTCTPIYLPFLLSENRKLGGNLLAVLEISAGRFFSYLTFGAVAGMLGASIGAVNRDLFTAIAYILLSAYLVLTAVRTRRADHQCHVPRWLGLTKSGFLLGVFTGINFCPAFLIALSNAIHLAGALQGMMLFLGFFAGTSLFLVPLAFAGMLARLRNLKSMAQVAAILVAVWFIGKGGVLLWQYAHETEAGFAKPVAVAWSQPNAEYFAALAGSLDELSPQPVLRLAPGMVPGNEPYIWFADTALPESLLAGHDVISVEAGYPIDVLVQTLRTGTAACPEEEAEGNPLCATCPSLTGETATNLAFITPQGRFIEAFAPGQPLSVVSNRAHRAYFAALADSLQTRTTGEVRAFVTPADSLPPTLTFLDSAVWQADSTRWAGHDCLLIDAGYPMSQLLRHLELFSFRTQDHLRFSYRNP